MSKIGNAVIEAQERLDKEVDELLPSDLGEDPQDEMYVAYAIWQMECYVHDLNAYKGSLKDSKADLDKLVAQLTKLIGKIK